jgi:hypothetical protein
MVQVDARSSQTPDGSTGNLGFRCAADTPGRFDRRLISSRSDDVLTQRIHGWLGLGNRRIDRGRC